jgi:hypothetical protein
MICRHVERRAIGWGLGLLLLLSMMGTATTRAWAFIAPPVSTAPTASPTATPDPTPITKPRPIPPPRRAPSATPRTAAAIAGIVAPLPSTLTASSLAVIGFQYTGNVLMTTAAGPVPAMEFAVSTATFSGLAILQTCPASKVRMALSLTPGAHAVATTLRLDATRLTATIGGTPIDWTVAAPPPTHPFAADAGTLDAVTVTTLDAAAATMSQPSLRLQTSFC